MLENVKNKAYLFVHFTGESAIGEQVYFAVSTDGLHWTDLNNSNPCLISNIGEKGVRDMAFCKMQNGKYILLATDLRIASGKGWSNAQHNGSTNLVIWESTDLLNWTGPRLVNIAGDIPSAGCAWAPEAIYDPSINKYVVYWATIAPLNGITKARIYYSTTTDFVNFSTPALYIDRAGSQGCIDTQILEVDGTYKYIRASGDGQISFEGSNSIFDTWTRLGDLQILGLTGSMVEGPILYKFNDQSKWGCMVDQYASGKGYLPLTATDMCDMSKFSIVSTSDYSMGTDLKRHGEIINITTEQYNALLAKWPNVAANRLQSYNYPTRYVRHYNFHIRIDENVSPLADSQFKLVPGLAGSGGYISFQSVNFPNYYLRHSDFEFSLAANDGTVQFAADATFMKAAGLADSACTSFQSYNFPTRYIRHSKFLLRLDPVSTTTDLQDATFKITN